MPENKQIDSLLFDIHNTIKLFLDEQISFSDAQAKYNSLEKRCNQLENQYSNPESSDFISGMLYHHNIENFSKNTVVTSTQNDCINTLYHCGEEKNLSVVQKIIQKNLAVNNSSHGNLNKTNVNSNGDITYNLYTWNFKNGKEIITVAALSSSEYFDESLFENFAGYVEKILSVKTPFSLPVSIDYFNSISLELTAYIMDHVKKGITVYGGVFIFDSIEKIFGHMGIATLTDITATITGSLKTFLQSDLKSFILSLNNYITVSTSSIKEIGNNHKHGIEFKYNDISLPYKMKEIIINQEKSIYDFWEEIFKFEKTLYKESNKK